jgi:transcriptional regulator with PAS, ATPase and Fis domain
MSQISNLYFDQLTNLNIHCTAFDTNFNIVYTNNALSIYNQESIGLNLNSLKELGNINYMNLVDEKIYDIGDKYSCSINNYDDLYIEVCKINDNFLNKYTNIELNLNSDDFLNKFEDIDKISKSNATILLTGESGTGKTFIAKKIHYLSDRKDQPFISINCSTIPENLFESELFGYIPGAFTGASSKGKEGLIAQADNGTLFLDEIGDLPLLLQVKLLELLQERRYLPIGSIRYKNVNVRVIVATNRNLKDLIKTGKFREDLFYRINVFEFALKPLNKRKEEIKYLSQYFLEHFNKEYSSNKVISKDLLLTLENYGWPGNIRELQNAIHKMIILSPNDKLSINDVQKNEILSKDFQLSNNDFDSQLENFEASIIKNALINNPTSRKLANFLGISQTRASKYIRKYS